MPDHHDSLRPKLTIDLEARRAGPRPRLAALFLFAAMYAAAQVACNDSSSPTAPALPPQSPPPSVAQPAIVSITYTFLIAPRNEHRGYPIAGELRVDGVAFWAGEFAQPQAFYYGYADGYSETLYNVVHFQDGRLPLGTHSVSLRVTNQRRSPTFYTISGWVDVVWDKTFGVQRVGSWQDDVVELRTGEEWSSEFVLQSPAP